MTTLLFPGRHLVNTRFQEACLLAVLGRPLAGLPTLGGPAPGGAVTDVVFAVTSANQSHSRYNPLPFHARALGVDRFGRQLREALGVRYRIVGVPHFDPTERFCAHILKAIAEETEDDLTLSPTDTVVVCSTPGLIEEWAELGFCVLPAEFAGPDLPPLAERPIDLVKRLAEFGDGWSQDPGLRQALAPAWLSLFLDFPELPRRITRLYRDPLLTDSGSLTETRDYGTYARAMDSIIDLKFQEIRPGLTPGKIVDEGCADGGLLARIARDHPDSDLIGIDIAAEFIARAHERMRAGEFGGTFVHFHQRNLLTPIFRPGSIDTTICNSTLHELWSYGEGRSTVEAYLAEKFRQTRAGGTLVIRDVVGFAERDREVWMVCDEADGSNEEPLRDVSGAQALATYLEGLSTRARFLRFARDFQAALRAQGRRGDETRVRYEEATVGGRPAFRLRFQDGVEFMTKMTYVDNWDSEMNESFAFWGFDEWKEALHRAGFHVVESSVEPTLGSRAYLNAWRVANDFKDRVRFFADAQGEQPLPLPPTNMILIGRKP
ncbi:MAG: methyltransferase domain-containing protein [Candidatus Sericytochromatia bacterium]|nr:methyltransferase domain-containing protein [Candidatus Sericytochromatia bacterium]